MHRLGYHTEPEIASELAWMDALRAEAGVRTPRVLNATDGRRVVTAADEASGEQRNCVRFEFLPGTEPADDRRSTSPSSVRSPPACTSTPGSGRARPGSAGSTGTTTRRSARRRAGDAGRTGSASARRSARCSGGSPPRLRARLAAFGTGPDRYGLVHADIRLANLLVDDGRVSVIDFDDSGFSWYLYDVGTSVSFFEHEPQVPG